MLKTWGSAISLCLIFVSTAHAADNSAAAVEIAQAIQHFYSAYIDNAEKPFRLKSPTLAQNNAIDLERQKILKKYLSPKFFHDYQKIIDETDVDPALQAQDWDDDYKDKVAVSNIAIRGSKATADVTLGGSDPSHLKLTLREAGKTWKIDSVGK